MSTTNQSNIVPKKLLVAGASGLLGVAGQRCRAANKAICGFGITVPLAIAMTVSNSAGSMWSLPPQRLARSAGRAGIGRSPERTSPWERAPDSSPDGERAGARPQHRAQSLDMETASIDD